MIVMYKGRRGAGKTLTMTKDAFNFLKDGWKIYSNIEFEFPHEYLNDEDILSINESSPINNCVLVIDEIQILVDSRRSGKGRNVDFSHFVQQIRKRNIVVLCTTQYTGTVDLRVRQHIDIVAKPHYYEDLQICEVTYIDLTSLEDYDMFLDNDVAPPMVTVVFDATEVFGLYDTNKIISVSERKKEKKKKN